jgi:hypothetical protein
LTGLPLGDSRLQNLSISFAITGIEIDTDVLFHSKANSNEKIKQPS